MTAPSPATLRCIGRVDNLGDPHERGSYVGFIYQGAGARHAIALAEPDAQILLQELGMALWTKLG